MVATPSVSDLLARYRIGAKFVRAYCREMGWRYGRQGCPTEWYAAWPEISREIVLALSKD